MKLEREKVKRRQQEFLDAAAAVFVKKGFHGATTTDIAENLGIKQGSLYYYFRSKEDALEQICLTGVWEFVDNIEAIAASDEPFREKVTKAVSNHVGVPESKRDFIIVFIDHRHNLPKDRRKEVSTMSLRYAKGFEKIIKKGIENGEVRGELNSKLTAQNLISLCNSETIWHGKMPRKSINRVIKNIITIFIDGVGT